MSKIQGSRLLAAIVTLVAFSSVAGSVEQAVADTPARKSPETSVYFPPPQSKGGWRKLNDPNDIRRLAGMNPDKLAALKEWLFKSDDRPFAAVVIRRGYIVLEVVRNKNAATDTGNIKSCAKAVCATVLSIASELSQQGKTPKKMTFEDPAFDYIPWGQPLSDPRKAQITVRQLLNHTSGITPESTGAPNRGPWQWILGHAGDPKTEKLVFDPGADLDYTTHGFYHASLVCESVTGMPYDRFAIEQLFKPIGIEKWWFEWFDGDEKHGRHPSHAIGLPAREMARIAYCMLNNGRWENGQIVPKWFVEQTAKPTHDIQGIKTFDRDARSFSHGWELPGLLGGDKGKGIPLDARFKPGSGGQLLAFVPSLDLVVVRQTGDSGQWAYEEYLSLACQAVLK
jgi:CubicO group peptidase (beta-lactamase class C family)